MEDLERKFEELSKHIPEYELDVWSAIESLEKVSNSSVENGQKKLEVAISHLNEVDELITLAFSMFPLSARANARLQQCLVSVRPRLNSYIEQLKGLIANPPTESLHKEIDDIGIFSEEESQSDYEYETNDQNEKNKIQNDESNKNTDSNETQQIHNKTDNNNNSNINQEMKRTDQTETIQANQVDDKNENQSDYK